MFNKKLYKIYLCCALILSAYCFVQAQNKLAFFKDGTKEKRDKFYSNIVNNINKTFLLPLDSANEEKWISAFYNIGLVQYKTPQVDAKINAIVKIINTVSDDCKKAFLNLVHSAYPNKYVDEVKIVFKNAGENEKLMAMAANYLLPTATTADIKKMLLQTDSELKKDADNAILFELSNQLKSWNKKIITPSIKTFFTKDYLPGKVLVFSFQRKDRNYPGLVMVRNTAGDFIKNDSGKYFAVGQLARSSSNMPGYISNGNTPQGFFWMNGFDTSSNYFIGPTTNIQLAMPHEYNRSIVNEHIVDSTWSLEMYKNLLPNNFKNYQPMYGTFYAGKAGRTEIISHGTTIDVDYYKGNTFYPYTPTAGCLCTKEIWNNKTGFLEVSDQLLLTQAVQKAGGANGYLIVIEIDDKKGAVIIADLISYFK